MPRGDLDRQCVIHRYRGDVTAELVEAHDLVVSADYGQIYIYAPAQAAVHGEPELDAADDPYLIALDDAQQRGTFVGVHRNLIDLMTPGQWNFETPMRVEVWSAVPSSDCDSWDHEVDVDLDIPQGRLFFEASGGGSVFDAEVPPDRYRVRVSGRGYTTLGALGGDSYRLRLWPRSEPTDPVLRKYWPGWNDYR